ncbi:hypothetical protein EYF80_001700 [Liparis tanakae]|uniref:Uncharacterized protein n=1 Tax=Liparis tanakae TaxID=230148 RepID=A0A4Z2JD19_9TELE|nr:hypothetical protein EYF80_001700 [Liparis tanakae]
MFTTNEHSKPDERVVVESQRNFPQLLSWRAGGRGRLHAAGASSLVRTGEGAQGQRRLLELHRLPPSLLSVTSHGHLSTQDPVHVYHHAYSG